MFTGIIEHKAKILSKEGGKFTVENTFSDKIIIGQSIAHDGACMTLTHGDNEKYEFFVMQESLSITNFSTKHVGDYFNVERSLKFGDRIDGHMITGHIDTIGTVKDIEKKEDGSMMLTIQFDTKYKNNIVKKGSIAINGVSLTIVKDGEDTFSVSLIPLTQDWTNLGSLNLGESINLEFDMLGKYVERILKNK